MLGRRAKLRVPVWMASLGRAKQQFLLLSLAAVTASCATDLSRDDLEGRVCPCLDSWKCVNGICVRPNSDAGAGGRSGNSGLGGSLSNRGRWDVTGHAHFRRKYRRGDDCWRRR